MLSWFYYRGSEHDRRSSLANQWNTYRDFNRLLCIADPAGRLGRSLTSWPEYSRNLEGFLWVQISSWRDASTFQNAWPSGTHPSGRSRPEHSHPEGPVWNVTRRKSLGLTIPHGLRLDVKLLELRCSSGRNVDPPLESSHSCTTGRMSP
jgi:hypothetical protein